MNVRDGKFVRFAANKQVRLFVHLAKIVWQLSCRISWSTLGPTDRLHVKVILPMLERATAKATNAVNHHSRQ